MKIFVSTSYSSRVDYATGEVFPEYREWLEEQLTTLESYGHTVFCALRADNYKINNEDPGKGYHLDKSEIEKADGLIAFLNEKVSAGVQIEIGMALALEKPVVFVREPHHELSWYNKAIALSGEVKDLKFPIKFDPFADKKK